MEGRAAQRSSAVNQMEKVLAVAEGSIDQEMVEESVRHIRTVLALTVYKGAMEIGDYVLDRFFDGDVRLVGSKNPRKSASFRSLVERCGTADLPISKTWLHSAVGIAVVRRSLPSATAFKELTPTHQSILLVLRNPDRIETLAQRAVSEKLTVRALRAVVKEQLAMRPTDSAPAESRKKSILEVLREVLDKFIVNRKAFAMAEIEQLPCAAADGALEVGRELINRLSELVEKLESREPISRFWPEGHPVVVGSPEVDRSSFDRQPAQEYRIDSRAR